MHENLRYTFVLSQPKAHDPRERSRINIPACYHYRLTWSTYHTDRKYEISRKIFVRTIHPFHDFRVFNDVSRESEPGLICRALDQQLESCVEKYTGRSQVRCSYLLASTSLPFFLSLPPTSSALSLLLSLSLACFSYLRSFLSAPRCAGICEIDRERSITPHNFVGGKCINIHAYASYAIVTYSGLEQELMAFLRGFFFLNWNCLATGSFSCAK